MPSDDQLVHAVHGDSHQSDLIRWLCVVSVAFGTFVMVTTEFLPIGLLSLIAKDLGVTEGTAGLMVTTPGMVAAFAAPAAAFGLHRIDRRRLLLALTALVLVSNGIAVFSTSFPVMLLGRLLLGISVGSFWAFAGAVGRRLVAERHGATATAIVMAGISIGTVLGLPVGTILGNWAGWRAAFETSVLLAALALVAQWRLLPELKSEATTVRSRIREAFGKPMLWAGLGFAFLIVLGHFVGYTYVEPYLTQKLGLDATWLSADLAAYGVAGLVGNFVGAQLAERNVRRTLQAAAALLSVSAFGLVVARSAPGWATLAVLSWGFAFGAIPTCVQIWVYSAAPAIFETSSAFMVTVFQIALASGAWLGGLSADSYGLDRTILIGASVVGAGVVAMFSLRMLKDSTSSKES